MKHVRNHLIRPRVILGTALVGGLAFLATPGPAAVAGGTAPSGLDCNGLGAGAPSVRTANYACTEIKRTSATDPTDEVEGEEDEGQDGREGMLEVGMRFVGSWLEFRGLRINPARGIVVVDDRLVDMPQDQTDLLEILMYAGTRTLTSRQLAMRLRGQTEETSTTTAVQDQRWLEALMTGLRIRIKDDEASPRWFESLPNGRYRLVRLDAESGDDAAAQDDAGGA